MLGLCIWCNVYFICNNSPNLWFYFHPISKAMDTLCLVNMLYWHVFIYVLSIYKISVFSLQCNIKRKSKNISYNNFSIQIEEDTFFPSHILLYLQFDKLPPQIENNKICFYNICEIDLRKKKVFRTSCKDNCLQFKHTFICWNKLHFSLIEISFGKCCCWKRKYKEL